MPFQKGQSGNPNGRPVIKLPNGRSITDLARDYTQAAIETMAEVMNDKDAPAAARVAAADKIISRGWGQAPQLIAVSDDRSPRDLSTLSEVQLEALETIRTLEHLSDGFDGNC